MDIVIDLSSLQDAASNPLGLLWALFRGGGWIVLLVWVGFFAWRAFVVSRQVKFLANLKYVVLAIDIPKGNEQTPLAVELIFSHLHGIQRSGNWRDRNLKGFLQPPMSFELISVEGQIQFIIRCLEDHRDLVEAAVFAQYPDAAISEVPDYVDFIPDDGLDAGYDLWGTELQLAKPEVYPIRTYPNFEHSLSGNFIDPIASLLEILSRLGPGEHLWLQLVLAPADDKWKEGVKAELKKFLGDAPPPSQLFGGIPQQVAVDLYGAVTSTLLPAIAPGEAKKEKKDKGKYTDLSPGEMNVIKAMQVKASKIGWKTKFRVVYGGQKEALNRGRGVTGTLGALRQFNAQDANNFRPVKQTMTIPNTLFPKGSLRKKQDRILRSYKQRAFHFGTIPFVLNIEELASIFHFPVLTVKAPMVQRTEARRGEPPSRLPIERDVVETEYTPEAASSATQADEAPGAPPPNLPL